MKKIPPAIIALAAIVAGISAIYCTAGLVYLGVWHVVPNAWSKHLAPPGDLFWPDGWGMRLGTLVVVDLLSVIGFAITGLLVVIFVALYELLTEIGLSVMYYMGWAEPPAPETAEEGCNCSECVLATLAAIASTGGEAIMNDDGRWLDSKGEPLQFNEGDGSKADVNARAITELVSAGHLVPKPSSDNQTDSVFRVWWLNTGPSVHA